MIFSGWLLDIYEDIEDGLVLWLINDDGQRHRLVQPFPVTFYVSGPDHCLRSLWKSLQARPEPVQLARTERHELFAGRPIGVMAVTAPGPVQAKRIFQDVSTAFPDLTYYDSDLSPNLRHAALFGTFPLARVNVEADDNGYLHAIEVVDSPWDLEHVSAPLRIMTLEPDVNPARRAPDRIRITTGQPARSWELTLEPVRPFLVNLASILSRFDPDLLLSSWGDTWLLPRLVECSQLNSILLHLSRDRRRGVGRKKARSYFTYGQVMHVGQQMRLFGRLHIDIYNAMMFHDYGMEGVLESSRLTALPIQTTARCSPGSGISAMEIVMALRRGILVPWRKQAAEKLKSARDLIESDLGGLVYAPILGLHSHVAELDFSSLYPACICSGNLSPERMGPSGSGAERVPGTNLTVDRSQEGLIPATISPLLQKRIALKTRLVEMPDWDPRKALFKAQASAHKWLLVTCFGYLGFKNARFGRIEAHMATTACGREALLRAKETAEDLGYRVLGLYVDAIWVVKIGHAQPSDFVPLVREISKQTGLPIMLEGVYKWLAFLPSRGDPHLSVANRYFGAFLDNSLKVRGIELRRRDTPAFIARTQAELLAIMARAPAAEALPQLLPELIALLRRKLKKLYEGQIPPEDLVVIQKLSREIEKYRAPSPAAVAASQLAEIGKQTEPGERVYLLYTRGEPGARAWYLPDPFDRKLLDLPRYRTLLIRAAWSLLAPLGISEETLASWIIDDATYRLANSAIPCQEPPLFIEARRKRVELLTERLAGLASQGSLQDHSGNLEIEPDCRHGSHVLAGAGLAAAKPESL